MKHFNIIFKPDLGTIRVHQTATLLDAAGLAGIILNTACGGQGTCKKCQLTLEPSGEKVLACQYRIKSDLTVFVPPQARYFEQKILEHGIDTEVKSTVYKKYSHLSDSPILGLAVDIGTTTVVAKLIDMKNGSVLAVAAQLNPQMPFGDDVVSRISYAEKKENLLELNRVIIDCLNSLIAELCAQADIKPEQIYEACIVGNTTMNHIFLQWPVSQLGQAPYHAFCLDAQDIKADGHRLNINPAGNIHTVENIAGFVGSDTAAVAIAVDIASVDQTTLVVDIGTNGEIVLAADKKIYAASCAAGPALEGARISCGSRAVAGAIQAVVINEDDIDLDVIGDEPARSLCGSGLIDVVAVMLELGIIDDTGRFVETDILKEKLTPRLIERLTQHDGQPAFTLANTDGQKIMITQKDIRQFQLAKAAIRAGIQVLQDKLELVDDDIKQIMLAGAFGNYIRKTSALRTGLLPNVPPERIHFIGNAAASGARMILLSDSVRAACRKLTGDIEYVEIAHQPSFTTHYANAMIF